MSVCLRQVQDVITLENKLPQGFVYKVEEQEQPRQLICKIEAIHAGTTLNFNTYSADELKKALPSWTTPYKKPVMTHHDIYRGEPVGRVQNAVMGYSDELQKEYVLLTVSISDPVAIQKILDERYLTVSVGSMVDHAICSICGSDWAQGQYCEHRPGDEYEGRVMTIILRGITFNEVSFVNIPADDHGRVSGIVTGEAYLLGKDVLESINEPGVNMFEKGYKVVESLGEVMEVYQYYHEYLHKKYQEASSETLAAAHAEVVRQMVATGAEHEIKDELDDTLPDDLKPDQPVDDSDDHGDSAIFLLAKANADIRTLKEEIDKYKNHAQSLEAELDGLRAKVTELETINSHLESDHAALVQQNADLVMEINRQLAERVVDLKVDLAMPDVVDREAAIAEYAGRTKESLLDNLKELIALKSTKVSMYNVEDPTLHLDEVEEDDTEERRLKAIFNLFSGKKKFSL